RTGTTAWRCRSGNKPRRTLSVWRSAWLNCTRSGPLLAVAFADHLPSNLRQARLPLHYRPAGQRSPVQQHPGLASRIMATIAIWTASGSFPRQTEVGRLGINLISPRDGGVSSLRNAVISSSERCTSDTSHANLVQLPFSG